jgi:hypothetical protein
MNKTAGIYLFLIFNVIFPGELSCQLKSDNLLFPVSARFSVNKKDSATHRDNIKLDPLKIFFNEISLSYEHFNRLKGINSPTFDLTGLDSIIYKRKSEQISSMNYIFGFFFPSDFVNAVQYKQDINYAFIERFDDIGLSPFINWGASVKFEYRRYRDIFYYGPHIMEKFVFYNKQYIDDQSGTELEGLIRLQSGYANILAIGYSIGLQIEKKRFVTDFYLGVSGRLRLAVRKIYEEQNDMGPNVIFPEPKTENLSRFYPFVNSGIRLGFSL